MLGAVSEFRRYGRAAVLMLAALLITGCPPAPDDNDNDNGNDNTPPPPGDSGLTGKYVGAARCSLCHANIHADWSETLHAGALETLEAIGQGTNASCLGCHTVGFGEPGGYKDRATTNALAGVGCENCHGPGRDHVENVNDETLRPPIDISSEVCGSCHTGSHHPNYDDWATSGHALVTEGPAEDFTEGDSLNNCGKCHSGDFFYHAILLGETVADGALAGVARADQHAVECAICHNPHARTGNAAVEPNDWRDYQLRYPEVASPVPSNDVDDVQDPARFNLCGQCHHDRGTTWAGTSRPPHRSNQSNVYVGEMPLPDGGDVLVLSRLSVHSFAREQCATCHMYRQDFQDEQAPAISGHTFRVNNASCATSGCHPSQAAGEAAQATLQGEVQARLDAIAQRLGDPAAWEYSSQGGPDSAGQAAIPDAVKQVRFLYYYVIADGSLGIHNPAYVRDILAKAEALLVEAGL